MAPLSNDPTQRYAPSHGHIVSNRRRTNLTAGYRTILPIPGEELKLGVCVCIRTTLCCMPYSRRTSRCNIRVIRGKDHVLSMSSILRCKGTIKQSLVVYRLVHAPVTRESGVRLPAREFIFVSNVALISRCHILGSLTIRTYYKLQRREVYEYSFRTVSNHCYAIYPRTT